MSSQANVRSIDALKDFRARLIVYLSKARPSLEDVKTDVARTRSWLENEQRTHWENQVRRSEKELQEAKAALLSSRISNLHNSTIDYQKLVKKAERSLEEATEKLKLVKKRARLFDSEVEPLLRQLHHLHTVLVNLMPKGVAYLAQAVDTLEAYANVSSVAATPSTSSAQTPPPAASPEAQPKDPSNTP